MALTKEEQEAIKKLFSPVYTGKIHELLLRKNILNRKGKPFSRSSIWDVMNGVNHSVLEDAIRDVWREEVERREGERTSLLNRTEKILNE